MNSTNILTQLLVAFKTNYINGNKYAVVNYNNFVLNVLFILYKDGLIDGYEILSKDKKVKIKLKYFNNKPLITVFDLLSKPSYKPYVASDHLKHLNTKYDYFFISTSEGLLSSRQLAQQNNIGGQVLFGFKFNYL